LWNTNPVHACSLFASICGANALGATTAKHICSTKTSSTLVGSTYRRAITLASGKFAVIQRDEHFTLVPWRAILERHRGREVVGVVRGMGVSWQLGMQRDRGLSR